MIKFAKKKKVDEPVRRHFSTSDEATTFQRSRTLTGSMSSNVRAANETRGELKSERIREHELRMHRRKIGLILFGLLVVILAGLALISQFNGSFNKVQFTNQSLAKQPDPKKYEKVAGEYFAKKPLERFSFAFHPESFSAYVSGQLPEVKSAAINNQPFIGGDLEITLREPVAVWDVSGTSDYVDNDGVIFSQNYFAEPTVSIRDESGANVDGNAITSRRFLRFVGQVVSQVGASGIGSVESVVIPSGAVRYVEFRLGGREYPYKAQIDRNATSQANDIINMTKYLDQKNIKPSYVDVRVEGKGYWK